MAIHGNITRNGVDDKKDIITAELLEIITIFLLVTLASVVSLFGIVFNVFNVMVFVKQGLNDTVNIGLMGLAVSDLCSLATLEMLCIIRNPLLYRNVDINVDETQHLAAALPHSTFARISSWVTAYIMLERCLCVVVPLKIKTIITPRVTVIVIACIFVFLFLTTVPDFTTCYMANKFDLSRNRSVLGLEFRENREQMAPVTFNISAGTQLGSFGAVVFLTAILVIKMKRKARWRMSTSRHGQDSSKKDTSNRDQKTIKMIILVAVIYCVCFLSLLCGYLGTCIDAEFTVFGAFNNIFLAIAYGAFLLDGVNSSVNIFVYYRMSTKFRTTFDLLGFNRKEEVRNI